MIKPHYLSDKELQLVMQEPLALLRKGVVPAVRYSSQRRSRDQEGETRRRQSSKKHTKGNSKTREHEMQNDVTDEQYSLLSNVAEHLWFSSTARAQLMGQSSDQFSKLKKECLQDGLIEDYSLNLGRKSSSVKMIALTEAGYETVGRKPKLRKRKNVSHQHWAWSINWFRHCRRTGLQAALEKELGGVRADVGWLGQTGWHAGEVVLSTNNIIATAKGDLAVGFNSVTMACKNSATAKTVEAQMKLHLTGKELKQINVLPLFDLPLVPDFIREIRGEGLGA